MQLKPGNHYYIVYNEDGEEECIIQAKNLNAAEAEAKRRFGEKVIVSYTEI